jgi:Holliday junction DNA helicase RuvA subunit
MITFLHGKLVEALPTQVTVDVNGVGYEALIPLSSYDKLPAPGQEVKLLTHLVVREDAHTLYGFMSTAERDLFRLLINTVSGIGPKIALNVLSGISVAAFRGAVAKGTLSPCRKSPAWARRRRSASWSSLKTRSALPAPGRPRARNAPSRPRTRRSTTPCWL